MSECESITPPSPPISREREREVCSINIWMMIEEVKVQSEKWRDKHVFLYKGAGADGKTFVLWLFMTSTNRWTFFSHRIHTRKHALELKKIVVYKLLSSSSRLLCRGRRKEEEKAGESTRRRHRCFYCMCVCICDRKKCVFFRAGIAKKRKARKDLLK